MGKVYSGAAELPMRAKRSWMELRRPTRRCHYGTKLGSERRALVAERQALNAENVLKSAKKSVERGKSRPN